MATKPHTRLTLDEAVEASDWKKRKISRRRATTAGIVGLFFGYMGAHDFIMRHKKRGFVHLISAAIAITMFFMPFLYGVSVVYGCRHPELNLQCVDISEYDDMLNVIMIIGMVLTAGVIIWGIVESIIILRNRDCFPKQ